MFLMTVVSISGSKSVHNTARLQSTYIRRASCHTHT